MKIVVMGGAGRLGAGVTEILAQDHEVVAASRRSGVDVLTGRGLAEVLIGADVVIDVLNSPSFEDAAALAFFETSTRRLLDMEIEAGVGHHVALSIVGAERLIGSGYFRAKLAQERQVMGAGLPYTLLRATQFFEFLGAIVENGAKDGEIRLAPARIQPIAADDVAFALSRLAIAPPRDAIIEVAGPDPWRLDEIVRAFLAATGDPRRVVADPEALYFGTPLNDETLMAGEVPRFGHTEFDAWLRRWVREHAPATTLS
ncbi:MAG: SDR family oxidoreductase [Pseudomonadota bacterium]